MSAERGRTALDARAAARVGELTEYERRHPDRGPDAEGRTYDPERDVIAGWRTPWVAGERTEVDAARSATIRARTWEGFAWADHRFVVSDQWGNTAIVGYNEDARRWFVDTTTPVRLPPGWVAEFVAELDALGNITGLENPRELHERIVGVAGSTHPTIPSLDEVAEFLRGRRTP